jgi:hypothetical protein
MELCPKFIIEGDRLVMSKVIYHKELVTDETKVKGGGWFKFDQATNTFIFSGSSFDFGQARIEDIKQCVESGNVFSYKFSDDSLTGDHKFAYDTQTEIIPLN